jgi:hypothetical protein
MTAANAAPYETLARMIERELELVGAGRLDELAELSTARDELIAALPATPPAAAGPALERAALMNKRLEIELLRRREAVLLELAKVERAQRAARGYAPPRPSAPQISARA